MVCFLKLTKFNTILLYSPDFNLNTFRKLATLFPCAETLLRKPMLGKNILNEIS